MSDKIPEQAASITGIRANVISSAIKNLEASNLTLAPEFLAELTELLSTAKPVKSEAFLALFDKYVEREA